jgi:hypothetical protein
MAPTPHTVAFTFAMVLALAVFLAITTWAAAPKHESGSAGSPPGKAANYRPELWKLY